jgi:fructose-bisphosphate aldolase, class I
MNSELLVETARSLVVDGKGILAMDESNQTCNKRFADLGIAQTTENRRAWRELLLTTPGLNDYISGVILYEETLRQHTQSGDSFMKLITDVGMIPGIKMDTGAKELAGHNAETITEGLDGLRDRAKEYVLLGARFAKWRAVIRIGSATPSDACIVANSNALSRYAALCQEVGLVPIVEPEVLMEGNHTLAQCSAITEQILRAVFNQLYVQGVMLEGMILKPNMVINGLDSKDHASVDEVAEATVKCLLRSVPAAVPVVAFLSGGQSAELASTRLNAMSVKYGLCLPWELTFSFSRAIQQPALELWRGEVSQKSTAQKAILHRAKCNWAARHGQYCAAMEQMCARQQTASLNKSNL